MSNLLLGVRFALAADRTSWLRALLAAAGVAVCLFTLLSLAAADSAMSARTERLEARSPVPATSGTGTAGQGARQPHVLMRQSEDFTDGRTVTRILVDNSGRGSGGPASGSPAVAPPPGLDRLPGRGQCAVSPALHTALTTTGGNEGRALRARYCGGSTDIVRQQGLLGPDELLAYTGTDRLDAKDDDTDAVTAFGNSGATGDLSGAGVLVSGGQLLALAALALSIPLAVLVSACARMTSRARERRLAALRLAGADRHQASLVLAGETLVPVLLGCAAAWAAFATLRPLSGGLRVAGYGWYPADLRPGVLGVLACVLLVAASIVVARRAGERSLRSPYGSRQTTEAPRNRKWGLVPLLLGWTVLAGVSVHGVPPQDAEFWALVLYAAMVLCLLGLPTTMPLLTRLTARALARRTGRLPLQLAARRLAHGAGETSRSATTLAVGCVTLVSAVLLLSIFTQAGTSDPRAALRTPQGRVVVADTPSPAVLEAQQHIRGAEGVRAVVPLRKLEPPASGNELGSSVLVADCHELQSIWDRSLPGCTSGTTTARIAHPGAAETPAGERVSVDYGSSDDAGDSTVSFRAPHRTVELPATWGQLASLDAQVLLSPDAPELRGRQDAPAQQLFVFTDGSADAEQNVRAALTAADPQVSLSSSAGDVAKGVSETAPQSAAVEGAAVATTAVLLLSMALTGIDTAAGRRRNTSALVVTGAPVRILRLAQLAYLAVPMVWCAVSVTVTGLLLNTVFARITETPMRLNPQVAEVMVGTSAAGLALCLPIALLVGSRRPDPSALRAE